MKLVDPTDFEILRFLEDGKRNMAANIALEIDRDRAYINSRLPILTDYGLVKKIGPAERSGLYRITEKGLLLIDHRDAYRQGDASLRELIESRLE